MKAKDCKCIKCGKAAVAFWPVVDPDIPSFAYCRECLDKARMKLLIKLTNMDYDDSNPKHKG